MFTLASGPRRPDLVATEIRCPHGYTQEFFESLLDLEAQPDVAGVQEKLYSTYQRDRVVGVVAREQECPRDLAAMLDELVNNALLDTIIREGPPDRDHPVGLAGFAARTRSRASGSSDWG